MILVTGRLYQLTLRLGLFKQVISNDMIAGEILDAGFVNVTIWGSGRDRFARGEWGGHSREDIDHLPESVTKIVQLN